MAHRIILLNFSERENRVLTKAGFNIERGFLGRRAPAPYAFHVPHPLYEYDVLVYNSHITSEVEQEFHDFENLLDDKGSLEALKEGFRFTPKVRIAFLGDSAQRENLLFGGLPFIKIVEADKNVSAIVESDPVGGYYSWPTGPEL